jgi:hypothetical protein
VSMPRATCEDELCHENSTKTCHQFEVRSVLSRQSVLTWVTKWRVIGSVQDARQSSTPANSDNCRKHFNELASLLNWQPAQGSVLRHITY